MCRNIEGVILTRLDFSDIAVEDVTRCHISMVNKGRGNIGPGSETPCWLMLCLYMYIQGMFFGKQCVYIHSLDSFPKKQKNPLGWMCVLGYIKVGTSLGTMLNFNTLGTMTNFKIMTEQSISDPWPHTTSISIWVNVLPIMKLEMTLFMVWNC